ncbi:MAG: hypothetical protein AVDCRST_MAG68-2277, partial [uncultured Gemmatimonadetes bacterium]
VRLHRSRRRHRRHLRVHPCEHRVLRDTRGDRVRAQDARGAPGARHPRAPARPRRDRARQGPVPAPHGRGAVRERLRGSAPPARRQETAGGAGARGQAAVVHPLAQLRRGADGPGGARPRDHAREQLRGGAGDLAPVAPRRRRQPRERKGAARAARRHRLGAGGPEPRPGQPGGVVRRRHGPRLRLVQAVHPLRALWDRVVRRGRAERGHGGGRRAPVPRQRGAGGRGGAGGSAYDHGDRQRRLPGSAGRPRRASAPHRLEEERAGVPADRQLPDAVGGVRHSGAGLADDGVRRHAGRALLVRRAQQGDGDPLHREAAREERGRGLRRPQERPPAGLQRRNAADGPFRRRGGPARGCRGGRRRGGGGCGTRSRRGTRWLRRRCGSRHRGRGPPPGARRRGV